MVNKTAVQWLFEEYKKREIATDEIVELFVKAEQMEKEQIIDAYEHIDYNLDDGLHYYEQTFKSE